MAARQGLSGVVSRANYKYAISLVKTQQQYLTQVHKKLSST